MIWVFLLDFKHRLHMCEFRLHIEVTLTLALDSAETLCLADSVAAVVVAAAGDVYPLQNVRRVLQRHSPTPMSFGGNERSVHDCSSASVLGASSKLSKQLAESAVESAL